MPTVSISLMLAVHNAGTAAEWYKRALGAEELWNFGGVVGLIVEGAPFFLGEPANNGWNTPADAGTRTARVELFVDDPDSFVERAVAAGAEGSADDIRDHETAWGVHRQGGFTDPFGHIWLVGDKSPLQPFRDRNRSCRVDDGRARTGAPEFCSRSLGMITDGGVASSGR